MPHGNGIDNRLHSALMQLYEAGGKQTFLNRFMTAVSTLLPGDVHAGLEVNFRTRTLQGPLTPVDAIGAAFGSVENAAQAMRELLNDRAENPLIYHAHSPGEARAVRMADFFTRAQFHETAVYRSLYRPMRLEQVAALTFQPDPAEPDVILGIAACRSSPAFTDRERDLLQQLGPHVLLAYRNAERFTELELVAGLSPEQWERAAARLRLTARQAEVMRAVCQGASNKKTAKMLGVSALTVKKHLENIYLALGVTSREEAIMRLLSASEVDA
jgi:DNA-binding CsgD family transcriptional regulator